MTEDLPLMSTGTGAVRLHGSVGQVGLSLGASRTLDLTSDVHLVLDHRATAAVQLRGDRDEITLQGFAARSRLWTAKDTSERSATGGGAASWRRSLDRGLAFTVSAELAR
jgi:hypothetical protein